MNNDFPNNLKEAIKSNKLIVFVGSGLSTKFELPNWTKLVEDVIIKIDKEDLNDFLPVLKKGIMAPLDVLEYLKDEHNTVREYIKNNFQIKKGNFNTHKEIIELSGKIITTNYDNAFEMASGNSIIPTMPTSNFNISQINKTEDSYIFKIHGSYNEPDNCVIFKDDYEKLYSKENATNSKLKSIFTDKTILFIGFSFNDKEINSIFNKLDEIFDNQNKHFIITTTPKDFSKFKFLECISIENHNLIDSLIAKYLEFKIKNQQLPQNIVQTKEIESDIKEKNIVVNVLIPDSIDKDFHFKHEYIQKSFQPYNITANIGYLNLSTLREIENGYVYIFTTTIKDNLIIEDEYLKSKQINILDILNELPLSIDGVFIFTNRIPKYTETEIKLPLAFFLNDYESDKIIKDNLSSINHKLFKQNKITADYIHNQEDFHFYPYEKGSCKINIFNPIISKQLDVKLLSNFIGRKTDTENIIRKFIDLEYENKILSIKGAGGIGKTTIVSKAAIELSKRKIFKEIHFIACQAISTYENFEYQISRCFNLDTSVKLREQIIDTVQNREIVIILDNFETLLNVPENKDIVDLVTFLSNYSMIVTTTRQTINLDFEEIYELRNMTSIEGTKLFKLFFKGTVKESEELLLKNEIIDELLNNNPLAIKLIAKGTLSSKRLTDLRDELKSNLFLNEEIEKIFEKPEDINIEKSKSLYYSIKYSYDKLNEKEKLAFELLSIFPDGIHFENFKFFSKKTESKFQIGDAEIKGLDEKSLLENSGGFLKLQSIINRFSNYQFKKRDEAVIKNYYTSCYKYNSFFHDLFSSGKHFKPSKGLVLHDQNLNNYLKCLENLNYIDETKEKLIDFIDSIAGVFRNINQFKDIIKLIKSKIVFFEENKKNKLAIELVLITLIYWEKEFDDGLMLALERVPIKDLQNYLTNEPDKNLLLVDDTIFTSSAEIYECEGYSLPILNALLSKGEVKFNMETGFYRTGFLKIAKELDGMDPDKSFFNFEIQLANNSLDELELKNYIKKLYKKETLEIIQTNYTKLKLSDFKEKIDTKKLVITNPYTNGIILLIEALQEVNIEAKRKLFQKSLTNLLHIKFFYLEAMLFYCRFLKENNLEDFENQLKKGADLTKKYQYMYLNYCFNKELGSIKDEYDESKNYGLLAINEVELKEFIKNYKKNRQGKIQSK